MSKYSKYSKHSSTNDFLNIVNANPYSSYQSTPNNNNIGLDFDFTFDIKKFIYWFALFVIGYMVQPLVVYNLLPTKIQNAKQGKKEDGSAWTSSDFNNYTDNSETKAKLANDANQEENINANKKIIGSKISSLFIIAVFTYIFGNWTNNINFQNKQNLILMTVGAFAGTFALELLKSAGETTDLLNKIEKTIPGNTDYYKDFKFDIGHSKHAKSIYTLVSIILIIFIIPLGYGIYKSVKGGFVLYYISLIIICMGIFVALPLWVKDRISLTPWIRGLAIVTLLLCRFNDKFSFLFGGLAIGFICSETHWAKTPDCKKVTPSVVVNADTLDISGELTQLTDHNSDILKLTINNVQKGDIIKIQMKNGDNNITTLVATYNIPSNGDHVNGEAKDFLIDLTQIPGSLNTVNKYFPDGIYKAEVTITNEGKDPKTSIIETATAINPTQNLIQLADYTYTNLKFYSRDILLNTYILEYQNTATDANLQNLKIIVYDADQPFSSMANNHYYVNKPITDFYKIDGSDLTAATATNEMQQLLINLSPDDNPDLPLREPTNIANVGVAICATDNSKAYNKWIPVQTYIPNPDNDDELISGDLSHTLLGRTDTPTEITISNQDVPEQRVIKIDIAGVVNEQLLEFAIGKYTDDDTIQWSNKYFTNTINKIANVTDGTYSILIDTAKYYDVYGDYSSTQTGMPSYLSADPNKAIFDRSSQIVVRTRVRTAGENPKRWSNYKQSEPYTLEVDSSTISGNSANDDVAKLQDDSTNFIVCGTGDDATNITDYVHNMILDGNTNKYRVVNSDEKTQSNVYRITFTTKKTVGEHDNIIPNKMKIVVFDKDTTPENRMFSNYYTNVFVTPRAGETENPIDLYAAPNTTFENVQDNMVQEDDNHGTKAPVVDGINKLIRDGLTGEVVGDSIRWEIWINIPDDKEDAQLQTQISFAFNNDSKN